MFAISVASCCRSKSVNCRWHRVESGTTTTPPCTALRADSERMTGRAAKSSRHSQVDECWKQYDTFTNHRSTSISRDGMRQFNDGQEGLELEESHLNSGVTI